MPTQEWLGSLLKGESGCGNAGRAGQRVVGQHTARLGLASQARRGGARQVLATAWRGNAGLARHVGDRHVTKWQRRLGRTWPGVARQDAATQAGQGYDRRGASWNGLATQARRGEVWRREAARSAATQARRGMALHSMAGAGIAGKVRHRTTRKGEMRQRRRGGALRGSAGQRLASHGSAWQRRTGPARRGVLWRRRPGKALHDTNRGTRPG